MWNGSAWKLEGLLGPGGILVMLDRRILNKEDGWIGAFLCIVYSLLWRMLFDGYFRRGYESVLGENRRDMQEESGSIKARQVGSQCIG